MTYYIDLLRYMETKNQKIFTHREIHKITKANCTYTVVKELKKYLKTIGASLVEWWDYSFKESVNTITGKKETVKKKFKRYEIKETKDV